MYNNPSPSQPATIIGFSVNNTVEATLTDLSKIGPTVDTAIQNGANSVQGISFDLQDRNPPTAQALKTAAASAMSQAAAIAAGLNVHTGSVLHASEGVNVTPVVGVRRKRPRCGAGLDAGSDRASDHPGFRDAGSRPHAVTAQISGSTGTDWRLLVRN